MDYFNKYIDGDMLPLINKRDGEVKLGEVIQLSPTHETKYELFGICESIGVRANFGIGGTETAWGAFIKSFLNLQSSRFLKGDDIYLSGFFSFPSKEDETIQELRKQVTAIDVAVAAHVQHTISKKRTPIIIGGGHNNAYGNITGCSTAIGKPIAVINFDAHADFRRFEGRHSGNGFSYAMNEGFLDDYFVFGLQKNYAPEYMLKEMELNHRISIKYFDELISLSKKQFAEITRSYVNQVKEKPLGIEIDLDAVENILSSAVSPIGFSVQQLLQFISEIKKHPNIAYIHICEGIAERSDGTAFKGIGKLIAGLVASFLNC